MSSPERPTWTSRRSVLRSRRTARASRNTVLIALAANAVVMLTKMIAGLISGSAAMLAEAAIRLRIR
jgi:divalent metal cation (Fe/Co/Zn/Cd) transporter